MRIKLILALTSPTAFFKVGQGFSIEMAMKRLQSIRTSHPLTIAVSKELSESLHEFLTNRNFNVEILTCETKDTHSFAQAAEPICVDFDALMIHDASRPFADQVQVEGVLAAFTDDTDAVRPAMAFTETLKIVGEGSIIRQTLDRSAVLRISTPELIRVSAIDFAGPDCGWFLPLKANARTLHIEASPSGMRINTMEDRDIMELHAD